MKDERKDARFEEIGRVEAPELCALSGVLVDISLSGCRVHFPLPVEIDIAEEKEYTLKIYPSRATSEDGIELLCLPCWECSESGEASVGFKIIHSPDTPQLEAYIRSLGDAEAQSDAAEPIDEVEYSFI